MRQRNRIFADHFQFYIYDSHYGHFKDSRLDWATAKRLAYGYLATERAIYVTTVAPLNDHRVRVYLDEKPAIAGYERVFSSTILLAGGSLTISAPANELEDDILIPCQPGAHVITVCSSAIGVDELSLLPDRDEPMSDEEFLSHDDLEYYDIFIERCGP